MLRSTVSTLRLRSTSLASIPSSNLCSGTQSRTLVSAVLLSRYEKVSVNQLKATLKDRGLPSTGKKDDLIKRLLSDDTKRAGSEATNPIVSSRNGNVKEVQTNSSSSSTSSRKISTTSSNKAQVQPVGTTDTVSSSSSTRSAEGAVEAKPVLKAEANPPGLPTNKAPHVEEVFNIQIPYYPPEPLQGPPIVS